MAEIIGYDPITGEPIWDDDALNTPVPEPLPTGNNNPVVTAPPVTYDAAVYMLSSTPVPDGATVPDSTHQGIALSDSEVYQLVDTARWWADMNFKPSTASVKVLLCVDNADEAKSPIYKVALGEEPIAISSARS